MEKTTKKTAVKKTAKKVKKASVGAFAVIETGGKQYLVSEGASIKIEILKGDHKTGEAIKFDKVLAVGNSETGEIKIGAPYVASAEVSGTVEQIGRHPKIMVIKYKAKSRYFKKNGHRQPFFGVKISSIK